ncbi:MAG: TonB-dependent receptor family protein [Saprospiraceae bacterium]|nr:TonB-dependent receptor family protein [Saprospiraceae bacterium]
MVFLINGLFHVLDHNSTNKILISKEISPESVDSILIAPNVSDEVRDQKSINLNYGWTDKTKNFNVDFDYGQFKNDNNYFQPNYYYKADLVSPLTSNQNEYYTVADIQILSAKMDYEQDILGGQIGSGVKWTKVTTANEFLYYNIIQNQAVLNNRRSNLFDYRESVYAAYLNYKKKLSEKWSFSAGLRSELTDASGDLNAFIPELEESPVNFNYIRYFPSGGITYTPKQKHSYSLQFGRRINRPDYNEINPFKEQLSELSYSRGNKFLQPEQVSNLELGYTYNSKYIIKLAYSLTNDQITKLIGPDADDPRASYMSIENLATQEIYGLNISLPIDITKWWNAFTNFNCNYINNQADYGSNGSVNVQVFGYRFFQQHTFLLSNKWKGEVSGWYSGPGVWGGVFVFDPSYSLNLGVQRKFLDDLMNVRLSVNDIFYQSWWSGKSEFNGQKAFGTGMWDSRRAALSISFDLGNKNIKSRKRSTGIENESKRAGE